VQQNPIVERPSMATEVHTNAKALAPSEAARPREWNWSLPLTYTAVINEAAITKNTHAA
jgi:hypothetical protein